MLRPAVVCPPISKFLATYLVTLQLDESTDVSNCTYLLVAVDIKSRDD